MFRCPSPLSIDQCPMLLNNPETTQRNKASKCFPFCSMPNACTVYLSKLSLNKLKIPSPLGEQFLVTACLLHLPILDHVDDIAETDCAQAMSNGDGCSDRWA